MDISSGLPAFTIENTPIGALLKAAIQKHLLHARTFHRILKIARTIADLEKSDIIKAQHLPEAIQYRPRWVV